jgi:hypothetical protein
MARISPTYGFKFTVLTLFSSFSIIHATKEIKSRFCKSLDRKLHGYKKEKLTHFRVFWHDIYSGSNPSVMAVVKSSNNSSATLGEIAW